MNYKVDITNEKMIILQLLQRMSELDTLKSMTEFFLEHFYFLNEYTIVNATDCAETCDLYSLFDGIEGIRDQLYTPFFSGKVNTVNAKIAERGIQTGNGLFFSTRCISFDTQTVSYVRRYYDNQVNSLPKNIKSVLRIIGQSGIDVDYIPYSMENLMLSEENIEEVRKTIFSFEKIYDEKASDKKCAKNTEKIINTYKRIRDKGTFAPLRLYPLLYAVLMEMCIIQIEHPNYSVDNKMKLLCTFMNNEVCRILYPELILAKQYFEKGQGYSFFGKIQKGRNDLLKTIHNMTWDLLHLRTLEIDFTVNPISISDINIPFFSHMIKDCWKLKNAMNYHQLP